MLGNAARTGIELSPSRCTVAVATRTRAPHGGRPVLRVQKFATFDNVENAVILAGDLKELVDSHQVPRHAWVTLWGVRHTHRYIWLARQEKDAESVALEQGANVLAIDKRDLKAAFLRGTDVLGGDKA